MVLPQSKLAPSDQEALFVYDGGRPKIKKQVLNDILGQEKTVGRLRQLRWLSGQTPSGGDCAGRAGLTKI